ncbi:MAG: UvrD-helicase domain-containing protein [Bacteroidales bacterium]|nr:UvrD-helicase domain-containing protein [Bacteroidales bacterium]
MTDNQYTKTLDVISASAGSGKTYNLAARFIDMLVRNPQDYQHILAVTFTIKATAEMMDRIVRDMYTLIAPIPDDENKEKREDDKKEIIKRQIEELKGGAAKEVNGKLVRPRSAARICNGKSDAELTEIIIDNCKMALHLILNDYSQFNISTIDSFVQKVIRAFAFEQGFMSNYNVELDTRLVIERAIDMLMQSLNTDAQLKTWMIEFVKSKMDSNEKSASWDIDEDIKKLAQTLNSDEGREFAEDINKKLEENPNFIIDYKKSIDDVIDRVFTTMKDALKHYVDSLPGGFDENMVHGKTRSYHYKLFLKAQEAFTQKTFDDIYKWFDDGKNRDQDSRNDVVNNAYAAFWNTVNLDLFKEYHTAKETRGNIYVIGILGYISRMMQEYVSQNHVMLLSKSNELLQKLIDNSSVPFIYEKIGTRFNNIMIDEFQDTSIMQWNNFEPLVANCLHNNNRCLLVGDIKQAIYRWRNSDWHTLADLGTGNNNKGVDAYIQKDNLATNWRSYEKIVKFNNHIFQSMSADFSTSIGGLHGKVSDIDIDRIYNGCAQDTVKESLKGKGVVQLKTIFGNNESCADIILDDLTKSILELTEKHKYKLNDILILVRYSKQGGVVMDHLAKQNIKVVSSDSLMVCKSLTVKGIIAGLDFIANTQNTQALLTFISITKANEEISELSDTWKDVDKLNEIKELLIGLRGKGLIEMVNAIVNMMPQDLYKRDFIFVEAFVDALRTFMSNYHVNLSDFIDYINSVKDKLAVTAPSNQDAITIMTIHKAKGLERKVVLIPFADWDVEPASSKAPIIWGHKLPHPFGTIDAIPVLYSNRLLNTYMDEAFLEEKRLIYIDNLNLIYVALTRAKEVLMMWGHISTAKNKTGPSISESLVKAIEASSNELKDINSYTETIEGIAEGDDDSQELSFDVRRYGEFEIPQTENSKKTTSNYDEVISETITPYEFHDYTCHTKLTEKNSKEAISIDEIQKAEYFINYGTAMHNIMEQIRHIDDIDDAVDNAILDGAIDKSKGLILKRTIKKKITESMAAEWFEADRNNVYTETSFLTHNSDIRPDRIVKLNDGTYAIIDYKFGFTVDPYEEDGQNDKYHEQVRNYIKTLQDAGFKNIKGYLWYFNKDNTIIEVKPKN